MSTKRPLLAVSRKDVDTGPRSVVATLPASWLTESLAETEENAAPRAAPPEAARDGHVKLQLSAAGGLNYLLRGTVTADVVTKCARCLDPAEVHLEAEVTLLMVPSAEEKARQPRGQRAQESDGEFEFAGDEADVATYEGDTIVLDGVVREAILLEVPISPLCSETCSGIARGPLEGSTTERSLDPRLAPLAALRGRLPPGSSGSSGQS